MRLFTFLVAVVAAMLVFQPLPPAVTMANQLLAVAGWGLVLALAPAPALRRPVLRAAAPLLAVFALAGVGCLASIATGMQPAPLGVSVLGLLLLAAVCTLHGASAGASDFAGFSRAFAIALLVGGLLGAGLAIAQKFGVEFVDGHVVSVPAPNRTGGHLSQPNQFADTLVWGLVALALLARPHPPGRAGAHLARAGWCAAALLMLLGVVLTGSRTGLVALLLIAAWGLADRSLGRTRRLALAAFPVIALAMLWAVSAWAGVGAAPSARGGGGLTTFRAEIWGQALTLIEAQPWLGVGWGGFGFAWSLTPFAERGSGLVDNAHDLPLQLAVDLGIPAALLMMGLLLAALWRAFAGARRMAGEAGVTARGTLMIVVVVGLHSLLEYPLWFAYLLLPTAWAFGLALGATAEPDASPPADARGATRTWRAFGALMVVLAVSTWMDYRNVVAVFQPGDASDPLGERIERARATTLFSYQGDLAAATATRPTRESLPLIQAASHVLVNGPLLVAWATVLDDQGQVDKARYLAARLREFDLPEARPWFAPCADPAVTPKPFQCQPPTVGLTWRDFR